MAHSHIQGQRKKRTVEQEAVEEWGWELGRIGLDSTHLCLCVCVCTCCTCVCVCTHTCWEGLRVGSRMWGLGRE